MAVLALGGCALQPTYVSPEPPPPVGWSAPSAQGARQSGVAAAEWWRPLGDSAIDALIESAFIDSPTLEQALARVQEARATLGVSAAAKAPSVGVSAGATRAQSQNTSAYSSDATVLSTSTHVGPSLSWEADLFGRVRQQSEAAMSRLDARTADAASTRLTLAADIANGVLSLRACEHSRRVLMDDITSRERTLALTRLRLRTGFVAPVDEARAVFGIASTQTSLVTQQEQCTRQVNSLVALSGNDANTIYELVATPPGTSKGSPAYMPSAPAALPELPATVLARHPSAVSAERDAAAAWAEIGVARANRLPRLDLAAALTGNWIRAAGSTLNFAAWSVGPSVSGTLFDGGAGAANVDAAEARYRRAAANLQGTLRGIVQDVENALAAQESAQARVGSTQEATTAARTVLTASEAQWRAGSISLFELEDSRRQFASARDSEISARRDQAQAWISLVKATGGATAQPSTSHDE